ncbi:MAG: hypothetical protein ABIF77_08005 [bacterium]
MGLLVCGTLLIASAAVAGIPDQDCSSAVTAAAQQVSVYSCPQGDGNPINGCMAYPGVTNVDATITANLCDINGDPVFLYPASDIWLESATKGFTYCAGGTNADADTDINGDTTFSNTLFAGFSGSGAVVVVNGTVINAPLDILFNSPDIDGSLVVNLTDVILFAQDYYGAYNYRSDFYWDGNLNLSDIVILAVHNTHVCP